MKHLLLAASSATCLFVTAGCSVVQKGTAEPTYQKLAQWKLASDEMKQSPEYTKKRSYVNAWIAQKQSEVTVAGAAYFEQIDLTIPQSLIDHVEPVATPTNRDVADIVAEVIKFLVGQYGQARRAEAGEVCARLQLYLWDAKQPPAPSGPRE